MWATPAPDAFVLHIRLNDMDIGLLADAVQPISTA
jgi:hypothetical protein